jgi:hypothetical protein
MGTVTNGESFARGNNIQITNCFDAVTSWPALNKVDAADFTNGVVYALLAEAAPGVWFLSAEEGGHPVLYRTQWDGQNLDYYVVGSMTEWAANEQYKMTLNDEAENVEYVLTITLNANDEFKVVKSDGTIIADDAWYPGGTDNNYKITADGNYTIYFRPNADGGDDWYEHYIFVQSNISTGINSVAANRLNGNIYNLNGQKVLNAQKGLYIIQSTEGGLHGKNGKKVVIR